MQGAARFGWADAIAGAIKQGHAELAFQFGDCGENRGMRAVQLLRRRLETSMGHYSVEALEFVESER